MHAPGEHVLWPGHSIEQVAQQRSQRFVFDPVEEHSVQAVHLMCGCMRGETTKRCLANCGVHSSG